MVSGQIPAPTQRIPKPFQTRRLKDPGGALPRAPRFKLDVKDARSSEPVQGVESEFQKVTHEADDMRGADVQDPLAGNDTTTDRTKTVSGSSESKIQRRKGRRGGSTAAGPDSRAPDKVSSTDSGTVQTVVPNVVVTTSISGVSDLPASASAEPVGPDTDMHPVPHESPALMGPEKTSAGIGDELFDVSSGALGDDSGPKFKLPSLKKGGASKIKPVSKLPVRIPQQYDDAELEAKARIIQKAWKRYRMRRLVIFAQVVHRIFDPYFEECDQSDSAVVSSKRQAILQSLNSLHQASQKVPASLFH